MVITAAEGHSHHHIGLAVRGKRLKKILDKIGIHSPTKALAKSGIILKVRPSTDINGHNGQSLIHGIDKKTSPVDTFSIAQGPDKQLPKHNPTIFDKVMLG